MSLFPYKENTLQGKMFLCLIKKILYKEKCPYADIKKIPYKKKCQYVVIKKNVLIPYK